MMGTQTAVDTMTCASRSSCSGSVAAAILLIASPAVSQVDVHRFPVDTSFTTSSAWESVRKQFPEAVIATPKRDTSVKVVSDVVYASPGGRSLHLDVYRSRHPGIRPAILIIHGGGWRSGNRHQEEPMAIALASNGYVAVTIEYRLSGEAKFPAALDDLKAGVRWLRKESKTLGVDPNKIAALGPSAGGTLALLLGTTGGSSRFEGDEGVSGFSSRVQAMVSIDGVADLTDPAESGKDTSAAFRSAGARWLGATFREKPDLWNDASPLHHADQHSPPVLFVNSGIARFHAGRDSMITVLEAHGIPAIVHTIPGTPHTFWLFHPWFDTTVRNVLHFLDRTFGRGAEGEGD